jgi:hypothetical protein
VPWRRHARSDQHNLHDVAAEVVDVYLAAVITVDVR